MQDAIRLYYVIVISFNLLLLLIFMKHAIYTSKHKLWLGIIIGGTNLSMTSYFISADPWSSLAYSGHNKKTPRFECICSKYGFGISISEGIIVYALNVMLLVKYVSRRVVMVSSWDDRWHQTCAPRSSPLICAEPRSLPADISWGAQPRWSGSWPEDITKDGRIYGC